MGELIYLDDDLEDRKTPFGWMRFTTGEDLIKYYESSKPDIFAISFDNDLGEGIMEGYDVLKYVIDNDWGVKRVLFHSANNIAVKNMKSYVLSANKAGVSNIVIGGI